MVIDTLGAFLSDGEAVQSPYHPVLHHLTFVAFIQIKKAKCQVP